MDTGTGTGTGKTDGEAPASEDSSDMAISPSSRETSGCTVDTDDTEVDGTDDGTEDGTGAGA